MQQKNDPVSMARSHHGMPNRKTFLVSRVASLAGKRQTGICY
jgi:hypothetical protein